MSEIKKTIQSNIALYRKRANLTQKELAARIGVAPTSLATWEQGKSTPDIDTLFSLCSALNVHIMDMYGFQESEETKAMNNSSQGLAKFHKTLDELATQAIDVGRELSCAYSKEEQDLVKDYRSFSVEGKEKVREYVADLMDNPKYKKCSSPDMAEKA